MSDQQWFQVTVQFRVLAEDGDQAQRLVGSFIRVPVPDGMDDFVLPEGCEDTALDHYVILPGDPSGEERT